MGCGFLSGIKLVALLLSGQLGNKPAAGTRGDYKHQDPSPSKPFLLLVSKIPQPTPSISTSLGRGDPAQEPLRKVSNSSHDRSQ